VPTTCPQKFGISRNFSCEFLAGRLLTAEKASLELPRHGALNRFGTPASDGGIFLKFGTARWVMGRPEVERGHGAKRSPAAALDAPVQSGWKSWNRPDSWAGLHAQFPDQTCTRHGSNRMTRLNLAAGRLNDRPVYVIVCNRFRSCVVVPPQTPLSSLSAKA
jgi:hypothetical protein